jgi:hypothetical protein
MNRREPTKSREAAAALRGVSRGEQPPDRGQSRFMKRLVRARLRAL